jgi:hypothetical protein
MFYPIFAKMGSGTIVGKKAAITVVLLAMIKSKCFSAIIAFNDLFTSRPIVINLLYRFGFAIRTKISK